METIGFIGLGDTEGVGTTGRYMRDKVREESGSLQIKEYDLRKYNGDQAKALIEFSEFYKASSCIVFKPGTSMNTRIEECLGEYFTKYARERSLPPMTGTDGTPFEYISYFLKEQGVSQMEFFKDFPFDSLEDSLKDDLEYNFFKEVVQAKRLGYFPEGYRMIDFFPSLAPVIIQYGKLLREATKTQGCKPVIIVSNEPNGLANLLSMTGPTITPFIIALTDFERGRLEGMVNAAVGTQLGEEPLQVCLLGDHDAYLIPVPYNPSQLSGQKASGSVLRRLQKITPEALRDWKDAIVLYTKPPKDKTFDDYDRTLRGQTNSALWNLRQAVQQSREDALTKLRRSTGQTVEGFQEGNNGYFHRLEESGRGLFLAGRHHFRHGRAIGIDLTPFLEPVDLLQREWQNAIIAHRELISQYNENAVIMSAINSSSLEQEK